MVRKSPKIEQCIAARTLFHTTMLFFFSDKTKWIMKRNLPRPHKLLPDGINQFSCLNLNLELRFVFHHKERNN